ncbi:hypothetical protein ACWGI8_31940 [Streptomyces sp. NPDC054841]
MCTAEDDASDLIAEHVHQHAHARDWPVVDTVRDRDRLQPLDQRPGWTRVLDLLATGIARGIVTFSPSMVAAGDGFEALHRHISHEGGFLVAARTEDTRPRRSAGDVERRRNIAAAAAGWHSTGLHA